jgi:hypothetical protein
MNPRFNFAQSCIISAGIVVFFPSFNHAAQFIEVRAEIESTSWMSERIQNRRTHTTRCIVGTNLWFFEGNFLGNATRRYWFTGTNMVEETVITSRLPDRNVGGPVVIISEIGERSVRVHTAFAYEPLGGFAYVSWMAFCSGTFLKSAGREILLPFGVRPRLPRVSDKTSVFEDGLGLPKRFELYGTNQQKLCEYTVQQSTNFLGWNLPLSFELVQYREDNSQPRVQAVGKVTLVRSASAPMLPPEVLEQVR